MVAAINRSGLVQPRWTVLSQRSLDLDGWLGRRESLWSVGGEGVQCRADHDSPVARTRLACSCNSIGECGLARKGPEVILNAQVWFMVYSDSRMTAEKLLRHSGASVECAALLRVVTEFHRCGVAARRRSFEDQWSTMSRHRWGWERHDNWRDRHDDEGHRCRQDEGHRGHDHG